MAVREVIRIDEALCDGCGDCVGACHEGAIAVVDGKARLVSEVYCDGLGACLGHCPRGAISVVKMEAPAFDAKAVERHLAARQAAPGRPPAERSVPAPFAALAVPAHAGGGGGCPGSRTLAFEPAAAAQAPLPAAGSAPLPATALRQWPVQLHLVSPGAPYFQGADVLLAADCVAFAMGDFHARLLAGRSLAVACPKLDQGQEVYLEKLTDLVEEAGITSLTVAVMQVPCCSGLVRLAQTALARASRAVPLRVVVVGLRGEVIAEHAVG